MEEKERAPSFFVDENLGKLAKLLRASGVDTAFRNPVEDDFLVSTSLEEGRIILSRDSKLLKRPESLKIHRVDSIFPEDQFLEVCRTFGIKPLALAFTRCLLCNGLLSPASRQEILLEVPARVLEHQRSFWRCLGCGKIFWQGTHHKRLSARLDFLARRLDAERDS